MAVLFFSLCLNVLPVLQSVLLIDLVLRFTAFI
jgi:hypothetical protein